MFRKRKSDEESLDNMSHSRSSHTKKEDVGLNNDVNNKKIKLESKSTSSSKSSHKVTEAVPVDVSKEFDKVLKTTSSRDLPSDRSTNTKQKITSNTTPKEEITFGDFPDLPTKPVQSKQKEPCNGYGDTSAKERLKTESANHELEHFKKNLLDALESRGGKITLSDFCQKFSRQNGKHVRKWFRHRKVGKVVDFISDQFGDIVITNTKASPIELILRRDNVSKPPKFASAVSQDQPKQTTKATVRENDTCKGKDQPVHIDLTSDSEDETTRPCIKRSDHRNNYIEEPRIKQLDPTPAEMLLLGKAARENKPLDVARIPNRGMHNTLMAFPSHVDERLVGRERPTMAELNEHVNQIRNETCRKGNVVLISDLLNELCSLYQVSATRYLNPIDGLGIRRDNDISAINSIQRLQGKVNAFIQAFTQFRNICTLHELEEELCKMEGKNSFEEFKLGPLQKQLLVYDFFKFPSAKEIPAITTLDVFATLWKCLDPKTKEKRRASNNLSLQEFMEFLIDKYGFSDPFESGVKIGSIPLAIQVVRKAAFGDMNHLRETKQKFYDQLCHDFEQHLSHSAKQIVKNGPCFPGDAQTLVQKISGMKIIDGFYELNEMLKNIKDEGCRIIPKVDVMIKFSEDVTRLLSAIQRNKLMTRWFHILLSTAPLVALGKDDVSILNFLGFKDTLVKLLAEEALLSKPEREKNKYAATPKAKVIEITKKWLSNISEWNINNLSRVECQIAAEVNNEFDTFDELGHGPFLKFIATDNNLTEIIETISAKVGGSLSQCITKNDISAFVNQCDGDFEQEHIKTALSSQFQLNNIEKPLHKLIDVILTDKKQHIFSSIRYLHAILCGTEYHNGGYNDESKVVNQAKSKIQVAPYLTDLSEWTNWDLMFRSKLGNLKDFIMKEFKEKDNTFLFMENKKDRLIKIMKDCSADLFLSSLKTLDARMTSTCLVSIINSSGHIDNSPIALLSNHTQNVFLEFSNRTDDVLNFCLQCFQLIPFEMLCCVVNKIFLDPLTKLHGCLNVQSLLLNAYDESSQGRNTLHALGFYLSINEWMDDYERLLENQISDIEKSDKNEDTPMQEEAGTRSEMPEEKNLSLTENVSTNEVLPLPDDVVNTIDEEDSKQVVQPDVVSTAIAATITNEDALVETKSVDKTLETCQQFVEEIRRVQFGIGESFGEKEQKLIDVHREREGRALDRLSSELYTRDSHFVLELIQNADDNDYPKQFLSEDTNEKPTVAFIVEKDKITILNNEVGFMEKNIKALCDVGKSTKGIHRKGYIGQKGIGFKSVFRVTDCPEIHSNGYHIKFDASAGSNGYILPEWIGESEGSMQYEIPTSENKQHSTCTWTTKIVLHLKKEMQHSKLTSRFHDIHPSLLMFLNRLHKIIIDDRVLDTVKIMSKERVDDNLVQLSENDVNALWFVVSDEIPINLRDDVKTTDISVAFPIQHKNITGSIKTEMLPPQPVFAFLPLRSYGFKFIIQADFEVPSSREDIDKDSSWNQFILQQLPKLVVSAFYAFKNHNFFNDLDGVIEYFRFMDLDDHVLGTFKPVAAQILTGLQREPCLPVHNGDTESNGKHTWAVPHSVVVSKQDNHSVITPSILAQQLGLHYIHKDIQQNISNNVCRSLGVEKLALPQLIEIAKTLVRTDHFEQKELHHWLGEWLHVVQTCMQGNCDYSDATLDMIKSLKVFALCDGTFVSLKDVVVFFPIDHEKKKSNETFRFIENDLSILSHEMLSGLDIVKQQLVTRLLQDLGVKTLRPHDLIHDYIIPLFKSGKWKEKAEDLVIACVIYLHQHYMLGENLFEIEDIKNHIALMTNKGLKQPSCDVIYLSKEYGNQLDLKSILSACDWTMIESVYPITKGNRKSWQDFFMAVGLKTFVCIRKAEIKLHHSDLVGSVWEKYSKTWEKTEDETYIINDLTCPEFDALIQSKDTQQLHTFACTLDKHWDEYFKRYDLTKPTCLIRNTKGETVGSTTFSSFFLKIRNLCWIQSSKNTLHVPRDLFHATERIMVLLGNTVQYMSSRIQNLDFICTLGVQTELTFEKFIEEFIKWCEESSFSTTFAHTVSIYEYLQCMVSENPGRVRELLDGPFFFLPSDRGRPQQPSNCQEVTGKFYEKKDVCWEDPSGIFTQSSESISHRKILCTYYLPKMRDFFVRNLGVDEYPSCGEYLNLVSNIANKTTLPDKQACQQIFSLFALLANNVIYGDTKQDFENSCIFPTSLEEQAYLYMDLSEYIIPGASDRLFTDSNIIPTSSNRFVSLSDQPILVLDEDIANIYKKDTKLPLIYVKDILRMLKKANETGSRKNRNENRELGKKVVKVLTFFKACNIPLLRDVVESPEVVPGLLSRGCEKWQQTLHDIAPYIQRYIYTKLQNIYQKLTEVNFSSYLKDSSFFEVGSLEVIYRLKDRQTVNIRLPKACSVQDMDEEKAYIYISKGEDNKSKYEEVLIDLMEMFVGPSKVLKEDLSDFIIVLNSVTNKEAHLRRKGIHPMPGHEIIWEYPEPEKKFKPPPPPPKPEPELTPTVKTEDGEQRLTCWPPRNPNASSGGSNSNLETVKQEERDILEKWQLPEAPSEDVKPVHMDESLISQPPNNQTVHRSDSDISQAYSTKSHTEINKSPGELKRKSSEIFPSAQSPECKVNIQRSDDDGKQISGNNFHSNAKNNLSHETANQTENITDSTPVCIGNLANRDNNPPTPVCNGKFPSPMSSPAPSPKKFKDGPSNFDASSIQPIELLEQYQDLPLLIDEDLFAGEDRFLQLDQLQEKAQDFMIGQIGEEIVYRHLCVQYKDDIETGRVVLSWLNNDEESGKPYDIKISFAEHTKLMPIYVEVKSTLHDEKKQFEISSQQLKFAFEQGPGFHLYRLSGMANHNSMKLKRLVNLATYMDNKSVKLFMIL